MPAKRGRALEKLLLCRIPASAYLSALCPPSANSSSFRHPRGRIERRGGSLLLRWIFQNQMLSRGRGRRGRRKDPRKRQQRRKGLERASAVCRPDTTREKDRWTTRLPFQPPAQRHLLPNCTTFPANFTPLFVRGRSGHSCTRAPRSGLYAWIFFFWEARFLLREIFHDSFFLFFLFW